MSLKVKDIVDILKDHDQGAKINIVVNRAFPSQSSIYGIVGKTGEVYLCQDFDSRPLDFDPWSELDVPINKGSQKGES